MIKFIFDPDDIYDLLQFNNIDTGITVLFENSFGSHFPDLRAIWLIDNDPQNTGIWADKWAEKVFNFIKPLTQTGLCNISILNGSYFGFEPEYKLDLPESLDFLGIPEKVILKVKAGKTISISWLSRSHEVFSAPYCVAVANKITVWERRFRTVTAPRYDDLNIELDFSSCLMNSCVIDGDALLVGINDTEKELIMYEFLEQTFQNITNQLRLGTPRILQSFDLLKWEN